MLIIYKLKRSESSRTYLQIEYHALHHQSSLHLFDHHCYPWLGHLQAMGRCHSSSNREYNLVRSVVPDKLWWCVSNESFESGGQGSDRPVLGPIQSGEERRRQGGLLYASLERSHQRVVGGLENGEAPRRRVFHRWCVHSPQRVDLG